MGMGPGYGMGRGGEPCYGAGPGYGMGGGAMFNAYPGAIDDRLAAMKSELGITAKQESAWQAFADNAKKQAESRQERFAKMREARAAATAPERLALRAENAKQRQVELERASKVVGNLYATLSAEQKEIADRRLGGYGPGYGAGFRGGPGGRVR
jgi:hypothetical protein